MLRIIYSRHYNIGFYGLERLHPFDSRKYGKAWKRICRQMGRTAKSVRIKTDRPASRDELLLVHTPEYLTRLRNSRYVAGALELPIVGRLPAWLIDRHVLQPMRWATRGTILAADAALEHGLAVNLSGGYHHAKPDRGEGFCIYADIAIAVAALRRGGKLADDARVIYVDTDAHQGNGVCHAFAHDQRAFLLDIYNSQIYPAFDIDARQRIDCDCPVTGTCTDEEELRTLRNRLPGFLDSVTSRPVGLAIYNAGTDVFAGDPLGNLSISAETILHRDLFVVEQLRTRGIPTVMLLSGGYTRESYRLVADSVIGLMEGE